MAEIRIFEWTSSTYMWEMVMLEAAHLNELCPELRGLLEAELAAGNRVLETRKGWPGPESIFVLLALAFRSRPARLPEGVTLNEINDPHWWKAEYVHGATRSMLACRFEV